MRPPSTNSAAAAISPHTSEGARSQDSPAKATEPVSEPSRSQRYASSDGSCRNRSAVILPIAIMATATSRKSTGSVTHCGSPVVFTAVK